MKKAALILFVLGIFFQCIALAQDPPKTVQGSPVYTDAANGYSLSLPEGWEKVEEKPGQNMVGFGYKQNRFAYFDVIVENLSSKKMTLDDFTTSAVAYLEQRFPDIQILNTSRGTLSGSEAYAVTYTTKEADSGGKLIEAMQVWGIMGGKAYILSFGSTPEWFKSFSKSFEQIVGSFQVASSPVPSPAGTTPAARENTYSNQYIDKVFGFQVTFPKTWQEVGHNDGVVQYVFWLSPDRKKFATAQVKAEKVMFKASDLPQLTRTIMEGLPSEYPDFHLVESAEATLAGLPAHRIVYSYSDSGKEFEVFQVWGMSGNVLIDIVCESPVELFQGFQGDFGGIVSSFRPAAASAKQ